MRDFRFLTALVWLALGGVAFAGTQKCVLFPLTTAGTESAVIPVDPASVNWTVSLSQLGCLDPNTAANVTFYGPKLDSTGNRGPGVPVASQTPGATLTRWVHGSSVVGAVSVNPVAVPSPAAIACVGGTNNGVVCAAASACPGGRCGPCAAFVAFCAESLHPDSN